MTLRRKLAVSTIAASVALTAFAGIPLSNKGLAEKLGVSGVVYAASAFPNKSVETRIQEYYKALKAVGGLDEVIVLRNALNDIPDAKKIEITAPIVNKITTDQAKKDELKNFFLAAINLSYSPSLEELNDLRLTYGSTLQPYATAAGVVDLTVDDIANYFIAIQDTFLAKINKMTLTELQALLTNPNGVDKLMEDVLASVTGTYKLETVLLHYKVSTEDVVSVLNSVNDAVADKGVFKKAALALHAAYQYLKPVGPNTGFNGGFGGGGVQVPQDVVNLQKQLSELKAKLEKATAEEKAALIAEAIKNTQDAINKINKIDAKVKVLNGVATLDLDQDKALSAIAGIEAALKALLDATGAVLPAQSITIDLGAVKEAEVVIGLSEKLITEAIKVKLGTINVKVNGLGVDLPVGGDITKAVELNVKTSAADKAVLGTVAAASSVYDFKLLVGGVALTSFSKPVVLHLPVNKDVKVDTELLTLAKIVEGKLEVVGGHYRNGELVENREGFSSYVVVENKVSFGDIASVQKWAGRSIEVVAAKGAINGKSAGVFAPSHNVTRAEFAKMLVGALDLNNNSAKEEFADVNASDWFAPYVAAAVQAGIINGRSATKFDPEATITRAEMATMISRAVKGSAAVKDVDAALKVFADAKDISASLKEGVAFAAENKLVQGDKGKFTPNGKATRAQAAVMIHNAIKFVN